MSVKTLNSPQQAFMTEVASSGSMLSKPNIEPEAQTVSQLPPLIFNNTRFSLKRKSTENVLGIQLADRYE